MRLIWEAAVRQFEKKRNFVLATILSVQGSSPRQAGAKILVLDNGDVVGTIGGGLFEANVRDFATTALASKASSRLNFSFHGSRTYFRFSHEEDRFGARTIHRKRNRIHLC
ncbi:MAG: XdhC family protein [Deltaproteobacteria bacterium]|nr:XdhC family protein [Deltaproteobacteria bacterium]